MAEQRTVLTRAGSVQGTVHGSVRRYLGIPYAAPLGGDARWAAPAPVEPWSGTRDSSKFGATAPTGTEPNPAMLPYAREPQIPGDDYLNVNVWTPAEGQDDALPVLVWIHGGGFFGGCSANPWYDGQSFAEQGLVFVSFNYRLAVEGFAAIPGAPNNRGVSDWIAALSWVRDNIAAFGGDPDSVTIFGQSAGGFAVANLLGARAARGLFHRAIIASGISNNSTVEQDSAESNASQLAEVLGVPLSRVGVNSRSSAEIVDAQIELEQRRGSGAETPTLDDPDGGVLLWAPVRDGELITGDAVDDDRLEISSDIPVLVGTTLDEFGWSYTLDNPEDPRGPELADRFFRRPTQRFIDRRGDAPAPTYRYEFRWKSQVAPGIGAAHSIDIPFFFNTLDAPYVREFVGDNPPRALAAAMHEAFSRFAREGNPGWAEYRADSPTTRIFDETISTEQLIVAEHA